MPPPGGIGGWDTCADARPVVRRPYNFFTQRPHRHAADLGLRPGLAAAERRARQRRGPGGHGARDAALGRPGDSSGVLTARAARDAVGVAHETLANQNKHVEQIQAFTEVGTRPEIDLLQAQTDQANAEVTLINAQNDYATARAILNQAMGVEAPASYEVVGAAPARRWTARARRSSALVDEAVRARPEVAGASAQLRAQDLTNKATAGRYGPALSAATGRPTTGARSTTWSGTAAAASRWPGRSSRAGWCGRPCAKVEAKSAGLRARWTSRGSRSASTSMQARLAHRRRQGGGRGGGALAGQRTARLDLAEVRYRTGVGNGIELSDAQLAATNAGFQRLQATLRLDTARAATEGARPPVAAAAQRRD